MMPADTVRVRGTPGLLWGTAHMPQGFLTPHRYPHRRDPVQWGRSIESHPGSHTNRGFGSFHEQAGFPGTRLFCTLTEGCTQGCSHGGKPHRWRHLRAPPREGAL